MIDNNNIQLYYLQCAVNIARQLQKEAIRFDNRSNWQGSAVENVNNRFQIATKTFSADLYSGLGGIAIFLAELYRHHPDEMMLETLEETINNAVHILEQKDHDLPTFSVYSGQLGAAFSIWKVGTLMQRQDWVNKGLNQLTELEQLPFPEQELDLAGGITGAIGALLKIYQAHDDSRWLSLAVKMGDALIEKATKTETSWSWVQEGQSVGLTGFSHGSSGMGLALLELSVITNEPRFRQGAYAAFNYERENFSAQYNNWPDFRSSTESLQYPVMWCHGAAGIAISRIRAYQLTGEETFLQEAKIALNTTHQSLLQELSQQPEQMNYSLCHGAAGNAAILLMGASLFPQPEYNQLVHQIAQYGMRQYDHTGTLWPSGVHDPSGATRGMEMTPGLMLGLAGTGLFYLQLAKPGQIESPLYIR